ncbi:MAG: Mur ligase family protein [Candidatus Dormibacteria bacterium]
MTSSAPTPGPDAPRLAAAMERLEAAGRFGIVPGLERTRWLLGRLGDPQRSLRGVLVAGTNGKGSVAALVESMARAAGRRTVLLAKPHLVHWGERVVLDGTPLADDAFAALAEEVLDAAGEAAPGAHPTQFEMLTVMGLLAAARHATETVVCEVGMGGARDSTNVCDLGGCVVTNVSLDHREWLGDTVAEIAAEKAGIIKPGDWAITASAEPARSVIAARAERVGARLWTLQAGTDWQGASRGRQGVEVDLITPEGPPLHCHSPLPGRMQIENLAVAAATALRLGIEGAAIAAGAAAVRWPGRLQWVEGRPPLLLDGAHNEAAMAALRDALPELAAGRRVVALFGCMRDKDVVAMLPHLRAIAGEVVLTSVGGARAAPASELGGLLGDGVPVEPVPAALDEARRRAGPGGLVAVCGSLALVGAVLSGLRSR